MPLIEYRLESEYDRIAVAIERLRNLEPTDGYYLAFSGGKDSVTLLRLAEMAGVRFDIHYQVTTIDPPEVVRFIKSQYPETIHERPERTMFQYLLEPGQLPPLRQAKWCCEKLKERGGEGRFILTGIRWAESPRREKQRRLVEHCIPRRARMLHPIIDWSDSDVWAFIRQEQVPYCSLYDEGFKRLGCILCPNESNPGRIQMQIKRWPQFVKAYINTFGKLVKQRKARGMQCSWNNGQELFDWWIDRGKKKKYPKEQMRLL